MRRDLLATATLFTLLTGLASAQTVAQSPQAPATPQSPSKTPPVSSETPPAPSKILPEAVPPPPPETAPPVPATTEKTPDAPPPPPEKPIEVLFYYGSEKQKWIEAVTSRFNAEKHKTAEGHVIRIKPVSIGSGEIIEELLSGKSKPHLVSPAAGAFIEIGNAAARERNEEDLVGETVELVRSPIVIMIWRDRAEALGWPARPVKWHDFFDYARDPARWQQAAGAGAGPLKIGHTNPDTSNSGLHALFLEAFAAANKFTGMTRVDVNNKPEVAQYLRQVEATVPYYHSSTGFLARRMIEQGPGQMTAAIVYENSVIEANKAGAAGQPSRVVAIYPEEGTFPSEHPIGVVNRNWVDSEHKNAARAYIDFLRARPQQVEAKSFGFRPSDASVPLNDLLTPALGVDSAQPKVTLTPPPASAISVIRQLWRQNKNPSAEVIAPTP